MSKVSIKSNGITTKVFIDDKQVEGLLTSFKLTQNGGELPKLVIEAIVTSLEVESSDANVEIKKSVLNKER